MHDLRALREAPESYVRGWDARGLSGRELVDEALELDQILRKAKTSLEAHLAKRNEASKLIGQAKARGDTAEFDRLMSEVETAKSAISIEQSNEREAGASLQNLLAGLPNLPEADVPPGADEHGNVEVRRYGEPFAIANPKDHADLGEALGLMDFEAAARMSGARFTVLKGELARLERALGQFMLDIQTREHGYLEVSPPLMVNDAAAYGTDKLPKFGETMFQTTDGRWLIPTAEVPLTSLAMGQILAEEELPM